MVTSSLDWSRARILMYDRRPPAGDGRICLLWPAWAYRVTAPVLERRNLDLFERVTLALCQAGIRQLDRIGEIVELDARLCGHILDRSVRSGHLDGRHELTDRGREALRTGTSAQLTEWQVCHVFEDPFTGELWPRTADQLREAYVLRFTPVGAELELGTAGRSDRTVAHRTAPPTRGPQRPGAARVVEAASADRAARRVFQVRQFERDQGLAPAAAPGDIAGPQGAAARADLAPQLDRIAFLADPEPVFLAGFLVVPSDGGAETAEAWTALDPFGLGPSDFFQSLIYRFGRDDGLLDTEIDRRAAAELVVARDQYRQAGAELRDLLERRLAHEFGPAVRGDRDAFDLMLELELAAQSGDRDEDLERVAHTTLRMYEVLFRRMLVAYPVSPETFESFRRNRSLRRAMLEEAAQRIGFHQVTGLYSGVTENELTKTYQGQGHSYLKALCALSLLAAQEHADHPLRAMAAEQPDLPVTLTTLNALRNRAAHAGRDAANPQDAQWCRASAAAATRALLTLPEPRTERTHL
ncbi:hypothetical protein [Plantactinospora sp. KBS50]|uniref:hypothetical protein n=1 Tax=Plantactinospora sp. KBS50 TaxID=2024580 RepID=UPI000BAB163D|nr:hypothetical protein [Plantactinospora sp. KBS50]ASW55777.1 hypothetical protein CIK06_18740 [Plantactinospora sp. KBS50]